MKLVLFDFDGTLTRKDSLIKFIRFSKGPFCFWFGFMILLPIIALFKLKIIDNQQAKVCVLKFFFKGDPIDHFQTRCNQFALERIAGILRHETLIRLNESKGEGHRIIIITASPENWVKPWAEKMQVELIGSRLEVIENKITGKLHGRNCYGIEKVNRLKDYLNLDLYDEIEAYGDSEGDLEMMKIATKQHLIKK